MVTWIGRLVAQAREARSRGAEHVDCESYDPIGSAVCTWSGTNGTCIPARLDICGKSRISTTSLLAARRVHSPSVGASGRPPVNLNDQPAATSGEPLPSARALSTSPLVDPPTSLGRVSREPTPCRTWTVSNRPLQTDTRSRGSWGAGGMATVYLAEDLKHERKPHGE